MASLTKKFNLWIAGDCIKISIVNGSGDLSSTLSSDGEDADWDLAVEGVERFLLSLACAGIDVEDPNFIKALETTLGHLADKYGS